MQQIQCSSTFSTDVHLARGSWPISRLIEHCCTDVTSGMQSKSRSQITATAQLEAIVYRYKGVHCLGHPFSCTDACSDINPNAMLTCSRQSCQSTLEAAGISKSPKMLPNPHTGCSCGLSLCFYQSFYSLELPRVFPAASQVHKGCACRLIFQLSSDQDRDMLFPSVSVFHLVA